MVTLERIRPLTQALADQIAAGEVVERPASVVKELVENAVDAGATRVDVELEEAGMRLIRVIDDGAGMHPGDLELSLRRHATSKIQRPEQLREIATLGFRGEALASIAAVSAVKIRSRRAEDPIGHQLVSRPGHAVQQGEIGMPLGTQVEVEALFSTVPARRKFVRSEATEVGHVMDVIQQIAAVEPAVSFRLTHGRRRLLSFKAGGEAERVAQLLDRRGRGPYLPFEETVHGVRVHGWLGHPDHASRQRRGPMLIVRRRVIRDRNLTQIVRGAFDGLIPPGSSPVACLFVSPPEGTVDVNVHPQKSEVRFAAPQDVYAAVRQALGQAVAAAGWRGVQPPPGPSLDTLAADGGTSARAVRVMDAAAAWARDAADGRHSAGPPRAPRSGGTPGTGERGPATDGGRSYRLSTRHHDGGRGSSPQLPAALRDSVDAQGTRTAAAGSFGPTTGPEGGSAPVPAAAPSLLCLLGHATAVFEYQGAIWAADLRALRVELVRRRLVGELGSGGAAVQRLLRPVVVERQREQVQTLHEARDALVGLGLELEAFGEDAVVVRGVPASWGGGADEAAMPGLVDQVYAWARLWVTRDASGVPTETPDTESLAGAVAAISRAAPVDTGQLGRLARRWMGELVEHAETWPLSSVEGLRRWDEDALLGRSRGRREGDD